MRNDTYYIGSTIDVERRLSEHIRGKSKYTKEILPIELVFQQSFQTITEAKHAETWIKKQKSKIFIERIVSEGQLKKSFVG